VAGDVTDQRLRALGVDGIGGAHDPRLIVDLAGEGGWIDSLDAVLAGRGTGGGGSPDSQCDPGGPGDSGVLVKRPDLADHPRARFARAMRDDVTVLGYPDPDRQAMAVISRGLAGLAEMGFELEPDRRRSGAGRALVKDALSMVPRGRLVVSAVAPGNAASLRALLANGFAPLGSIQLFRPEGYPVPA
jgi:GNAT superfamily N-acetyltransferase